VQWEVDLHDQFVPEYHALPTEVQDSLLAHIQVLKRLGPQLARPQVGTLRDSRYANMKELRFDAADGVWRVAFAFDPRRKAILLVAGDKSGGGEARFYRQLIDKADARFGTHLCNLRKQQR
jgi:hypothetical protein